MKCYNHHDRDAFGICKSCGKGLCLECLQEENGTVFCKDNNRACINKFNKFQMNSIWGLILFLIIIVLLIID